MQAVHFMLLLSFKVDLDTKNKTNKSPICLFSKAPIEGSITGKYQTESKGVLPHWKPLVMPNWWHPGSVELHCCLSATFDCIHQPFLPQASDFCRRPGSLALRSDGLSPLHNPLLGMLGTFPTQSLGLPAQCEKAVGPAARACCQFHEVMLLSVWYSAAPGTTHPFPMPGSLVK